MKHCVCEQQIRFKVTLVGAFSLVIPAYSHVLTCKHAHRLFLIVLVLLRLLSSDRVGGDGDI